MEGALFGLEEVTQAQGSTAGDINGALNSLHDLSEARANVEQVNVSLGELNVS